MFGLDVTTRGEGFLRMSPVLFTVVLFWLLGGLCLIYDVVMGNVANMDWRDMLFDHRVTLAGVTAGHKLFA